MDATSKAQIYAARTLQQYDANGNGTIDYRRGTRDSAVLSREHKVAFTRIDQNHDGHVGVRELRQHYRASHGATHTTG
ncbi:MAG: hypothetical protein JWM86_1795 [Thermoleophilia bacterium]|nr:hypothetical protein [Thermoleophilia bacterium]